MNNWTNNKHPPHSQTPYHTMCHYNLTLLYPPPPPPIQNQTSCYDPNIFFMNNSLMSVMETFNQSMLVQSTVLKESLRQSQSASKEHYLSNAKTCDGKKAKEFGTRLEDVMRLATISGEYPDDVALTTSKGSLHKHINELVASGTD